MPNGYFDATPPQSDGPPPRSITDWDRLLLGIAAANRRAPEWRRLRRRRWTRPDGAGRPTAPQAA